MSRLTIQQALDLALQHHQAGRLREAEQIYRGILAQQPNHFEAINNLGVIAFRCGQNQVALDLVGRAIALNPTYPEAHNNLGNGLKNQGKLDEAVAAYRQAIALRPNYAEAYSNLGIALEQNGLPDEAIAVYRQAIGLNPNLPETYNNLGIALKAKDQLDEAVAAFRQAINLRPDYGNAYSSLGSALKEVGQLDDAIVAYRRAIGLSPHDSDAHSNLIFAMHYHRDYDDRAIAEEHRRWNAQFTEPVRQFIRPHSNDRDPDRRLRIGYVSADFRIHVVGRNVLPLLQHHDRGQFEITCYANVVRPDAMTGQFQKCSDHWRSIVGLSDEQVSEQIRADGIDILVDLSLHTAGNRLPVFARKPAPVQVSFAGYPAGTGLDTIDYRLSDPYLDPPGADELRYPEKTVRLPDSFWCYDPLDGRDICVDSLPAVAKGALTFGCLNKICKIDEVVLALWAQVMREVPDSRLLLLAPQGSCRQRTIGHLSSHGIDPGRIEFAPYQPRRKYLETYHRIDLGLDSFPYSGHSSSLDSLWMGVPVVTLMSERTVSRAGWSQLSNLGLTDLVAQAPEQFVQIAAGLAKDLPRLKGLRATLRRRMEQSPLMDAARFTGNIESAYRRIWRIWCASEPKAV